MKDSRDYPGVHLRAAFEERGCALDAAEARRLLDTFLRLFELGALHFESEQSPPAYNMGDSLYREEEE